MIVSSEIMSTPFVNSTVWKAKEVAIYVLPPILVRIWDIIKRVGMIIIEIFYHKDLL